MELSLEVRQAIRGDFGSSGERAFEQISGLMPFTLSYNATNRSVVLIGSRLISSSVLKEILAWETYRVWQPRILPDHPQGWKVITLIPKDVGESPPRYADSLLLPPYELESQTGIFNRMIAWHFAS